MCARTRARAQETVFAMLVETTERVCVCVCAYFVRRRRSSRCSSRPRSAPWRCRPARIFIHPFYIINIYIYIYIPPPQRKIFLRARWPGAALRQRRGAGRRRRGLQPPPPRGAPRPLALGFGCGVILSRNITPRVISPLGNRPCTRRASPARPWIRLWRANTALLASALSAHSIAVARARREALLARPPSDSITACSVK